MLKEYYSFPFLLGRLGTKIFEVPFVILKKFPFLLGRLGTLDIEVLAYDSDMRFHSS